jgi:ribose transport system permease protein
MNWNAVTRRAGIDRFSAFYIAALFIVVFGAWSPGLFFSMATVRTVASQQAVVGILAIAVLIPLACGNYDLSVGACANLTAVVAVILQVRDGWPMWPAIVAAVAVGGVIGIVNGFVVVRLKVNSFIATLGAATVIDAIQEIAANGTQPFPPTSHAWLVLTQGTVGGFDVVIVYLIVIAALAWLLLSRTPAGRYIYAIGANAEAARLSGLKIGPLSFTTFVLSGVISGIAGVLYASFVGPSLTFGSALLLPSFAAVFMGSTQIRPGRFNVPGTLISIYVLAIGVQGIQYVTSVQWANEMFNGIALIVAVAVAGQRIRGAAGRDTRGPAGLRRRAGGASGPADQPSADQPQDAGGTAGGAGTQDRPTELSEW